MSTSTKPSWHENTKENFLKYFSLESRSNSYNLQSLANFFDRSTGQPLKVPCNNGMYLKYSTSDRAVDDVIKLLKEGKFTLQWNQ